MHVHRFSRRLSCPSANLRLYRPPRQSFNAARWGRAGGVLQVELVAQRASAWCSRLGAIAPMHCPCCALAEFARILFHRRGHFGERRADSASFQLAELHQPDRSGCRGHRCCLGRCSRTPGPRPAPVTSPRLTPKPLAARAVARIFSSTVETAMPPRSPATLLSARCSRSRARAGLQVEHAADEQRHPLPIAWSPRNSVSLAARTYLVAAARDQRGRWPRSARSQLSPMRRPLADRCSQPGA